jgi:hypothetical protein
LSDREIARVRAPLMIGRETPRRRLIRADVLKSAVAYDDDAKAGAIVANMHRDA